MKRDYLFHIFFLAVFFVLLFMYGSILEPFFTPILGAIVLLILAYPVHHRLTLWMPKSSPSLRAAVSTILVTVSIVGPFIFISWLLFNESQGMLPIIQQWTSAVQRWRQGAAFSTFPWFISVQRHAGQLFGLERMDVERLLISVGRDIFGTVSETGRAVATNAILSLFHLLVMLFTLFFLFRDGESLMSDLRRLVPMRLQHKDRIVERLRSTVTGIVRGSVATAVIQTLCATAGYFMVQMPGALTLGVLTGFTSFIPIVGTALVWVPVTIFFAVQGAYVRASIIFLWGLLVVSTLDNLIKTLLIGRKAELSILFLFFGILGGAEVYGLKGLLVGPLLVAIIPVFFDIYKEQYLRKAAPEPYEITDEIT